MPQNHHVQVNFNFAQIGTAVDDAYKRGLAKAGEHLRGASLKQAPKRDGILQGSSFVDQDLDGDVTVGYNTPYAARLHEHPKYDFSKDANPNAKGKYLEDPANEEHENMLGLIDKEIRRASNG